MPGRIFNVIKESELDQLSTSWVMTQASHLLCQHGTVAPKVGDTGSAPSDEGATDSMVSPDQEIEEPVFMKEILKLGPFQTQIIECKTKPLLGESSHVMIMPLRACEAQLDGTWPHLPGLHFLHTCTWLKMSSSKVSIIVRNMSDSAIFLIKGVRVACLVSASPVPPMELSPEMEALGADTTGEPMTVAAWQEKLLEKLNLDGLSNWTPRNAAAARELILAFHDIFALDGNELGCTSAIGHKICINNSEPLKEWFRHIPLLLLDEVCASLREMLVIGAIHPSQSPWCNAMVLVWKKDGTLCFCVDFHRLSAPTKKDLYLLLWIQEVLESMVGAAHFSKMDFKSGFGKSGWHPSPNSIPPSQWEILDSTSLLACPLGYAMLQRIFSTSCITP